jgi:hypothetical protein
MHVSDEILLAYLDQEVEAAERSAVAEHVERCEACADRLATLLAATGRTREALESLDVEPPWTNIPPELLAAARSEGGPDSIRSIATAPSVRRAHRLSGRAMAVAASMVLLLAAGAWAIPGSPVRDWVSRSITAVAEIFGSGTPDPAAAGQDQVGGDAAGSGVFVEPLDGRVSIAVRQPGTGTLVRVSVTDATRASVRATGGSYRVGPGSIEIVEPSGEMTIQLPGVIADARIEIDGRLVVHKRGGEIFLTSAADSSKAQILLETGG